MRMDRDELESLKGAMVNYPRVYEWLIRMRDSSLEQLPYSGTNVATMQGRCQTLVELCKLADTALGRKA